MDPSLLLAVLVRPA